MKNCLSKLGAAAVLATQLALRVYGAEMPAENLRCEYRVNPQGIDEAQPQI
jgi:hypothetical protein